MSKLVNDVFAPSISLDLPNLPADLCRAADGCNNLLSEANSLLCLIGRKKIQVAELPRLYERVSPRINKLKRLIAAVEVAVKAVAGQLVTYGPFSFRPIHAESAHHAAILLATWTRQLWTQPQNCAHWWIFIKKLNARRRSRDGIYAVSKGQIAAFSKVRRDLSRYLPELLGAIRSAMIVETAKAAERRRAPQSEPQHTSPAPKPMGTAVTAAPPTDEPRRRGRRVSPEMEEIQRECYNRHEQGASLKNIKTALQAEYKEQPRFRPPKTPGDVSTYAKRYAKRYAKKWPIAQCDKTQKPRNP